MAGLEAGPEAPAVPPSVTFPHRRQGAWGVPRTDKSLNQKMTHAAAAVPCGFPGARFILAKPRSLAVKAGCRPGAGWLSPRGSRDRGWVTQCLESPPSHPAALSGQPHRILSTALPTQHSPLHFCFFLACSFSHLAPGPAGSRALQPPTAQIRSRHSRAEIQHDTQLPGVGPAAALVLASW